MHTVFGISFGDFPTLGSSLRQMNLARAAGFEATELTLGTDGFEDRLFAAREAEVRVSSLRLPTEYANRIWEKDAPWGDILTLYRASLGAAREYGFDAVHMTVSEGAHPPAVSQSGLERLRALAKEAESMGVRLLFENTESMEHFEMAVRNVCLGYHGVAFRPALAAAGVGSSAIPRYAIPHLSAVVLDDVLRGKDGYIPFDGETDYAPFAASAARLPYRGVLLGRFRAKRGIYVGVRYEAFAARAYEGLSKIARMCRDEEGII